MKKICLGFGGFLIVCLFSNFLHAAEKFRAASGGFGSAIHAVLWVAYEKKIFKKYGLDVEYIAIDSGSLGMQTLLANETQVLFTTGALAINANLQGGNSTIIAGGMNFFPYKIVARPEIKSAEDLKGRTLAISRFGSATDFAAQAALEKLGLNVRQVTLVQLGGNVSRLTALNQGAAHAAAFTEPYATLALRKFGMRSLIDLAESGLPFPQNSFVVERSYLEANRNKVVNFMKGVIEGLYSLRKDKALAIELIKKYQRVDDEMGAIGYDYYVVKHGEGILVLPDRKGLESVISQVARQIPRAKGQTPESLKVLEPSILDEIKKSGFLEQIKK